MMDGYGVPENVREILRNVNAERARDYEDQLNEIMIENMLPLCGSPIEQILCAHLPLIQSSLTGEVECPVTFNCKRNPCLKTHMRFFEQQRSFRAHEADPYVMVSMQVGVGRYSVDFAISAAAGADAILFDGRSVDGETSEETFHWFIECDGHEFHEKTKEQVRSDKRRERSILLTKVPVLRFSGSEIFKDPIECVNEIGRHITGSIFPNPIDLIERDADSLDHGVDR